MGPFPFGWGRRNFAQDNRDSASTMVGKHIHIDCCSGAGCFYFVQWYFSPYSGVCCQLLCIFVYYFTSVSGQKAMKKPRFCFFFGLWRRSYWVFVVWVRSEKVTVTEWQKLWNTGRCVKSRRRSDKWVYSKVLAPLISSSWHYVTLRKCYVTLPKPYRHY